MGDIEVKVYLRVEGHYLKAEVFAGVENICSITHRDSSQVTRVIIESLESAIGKWMRDRGYGAF